MNARATHSLTLPLLFSLFLILSFVYVAQAQAQDTDATVETSVAPPPPTLPVDAPLPPGGSVEPPAGSVPPAPGSAPMRRPLDAIRERAQNAQQNINDAARGARQDLRANTQMQLQNASGTERRDALKDAAGTRMNIMQERRASSTQMRDTLKAKIQMHGGQIRAHFGNAIRNLNQFMTRIGSRIDKMAANGTDVSALLVLQADAQASIALAEADIKAIQDFMATVTDDSDRTEIRSKLASHIEKARKSIRAAHEDIQILVKALVKTAASTVPPASTETSTETTIE